MNFGIEDINKTIRDCKELNLIDKSDKGLIVTLPDEIVNLFKDYSYPTIHNILEVLLYYVTCTSRVIEFDTYAYYLLGEEHMTDVTIIGLNSIIQNHDVVNIIDDFIKENAGDNTFSNQYFAGWLINKNNVNFYTAFDFIILSGNKTIGDF